MHQPLHRFRSLGFAWFALCLALALHVADEAANDFLSVYNPNARAIRARLPWLPVPVFTFETWLAGLTVAVLLLLSLSPFAYRGARWLRPLAWIFATLMLANALGHFASSLYLRRLAPGVLSSPILLAASIYLLTQLRRSRAAYRLNQH